MHLRVLFSIALFALGLYVVGNWIYIGAFDSATYNMFRIMEIAALLWGGMAVLSNQRGWMLAAGVLVISWGLPVFVLDCLPFAFSVNIWMIIPAVVPLALLQALGILLGVCISFTCFGAIRRGQKLYKSQWILYFVFLGVLLCNYWYRIGYRLVYSRWDAFLIQVAAEVMNLLVQAALFSVLPFYLWTNASKLSPERPLERPPACILYRVITAVVFALGILVHCLAMEWNNVLSSYYSMSRELLLNLLNLVLLAGYLFLLIAGSFKVHQMYLYAGSHGVGARCVYWAASILGLLFIFWLLSDLYPVSSVSYAGFPFACGGVLCWILVEANQIFVRNRVSAQAEEGTLQEIPVQAGGEAQYIPDSASASPAAAASSPALRPEPASSGAAMLETPDQSLFTRGLSEQNETTGWEQQAGNDMPSAEDGDASLFREVSPPMQAVLPPTDVARFCRYCGAALPADSLYCPACGR